MTTTPLWAALAAAALRGASLERSLLPALTAVGGALLLLPVAEPAGRTAIFAAALCFAAALLAGSCAVLCRQMMRAVFPRWSTVIAAAANASVLGAAALFSESRDTLPALHGPVVSIAHLLLTAITATLTIALMRTMPPVAFSTRFLWTPLLIAIQGYVLFRPPLSMRTAAGAVLLLVGGAALIRRERSVPAEVPSLR